MKDNLIEVGKIAYSKSGRDAGKCFIICDIIDKDFVYLVDGSLRKLSKPKKKKIKHLETRHFIDSEIQEKLLSGKTILDSDIRRGIENYLNSQK